MTCEISSVHPGHTWRRVAIYSRDEFQYKFKKMYAFAHIGGEEEVIVTHLVEVKVFIFNRTQAADSRQFK